MPTPQFSNTINLLLKQKSIHCKPVFRNRIGSGFSGSGSGIRIRIMVRIQGGKNDPQKLKFQEHFEVLMFSLEGFSCSLDVLYGGLGIGKLQYLIQNIKKKISTLIFLNFWSSKLESGLVFSPKCWIRIRNQWIRNTAINGKIVNRRHELPIIL